MLYEMLAGKLPFPGEVEPAVIYSIMNTDPEPLTSARRDVPVALEEIIEKALTKDPEKRYASVDALLAALEEQRDKLTLGIKERRWVSLRRLRRRRRVFYGGMAALVVVAAVVLISVLYNRSLAINSIAVLPVANLTGDPDQEYFCDGITAALITELGQIDALRVISRTTVMQYKELSKPLPAIARELGVKAMVEASVLHAGDRVQMTVQLIRADPERQLWGDSYDRELSDVFSMYGDVARDVATEIRVKVTPEERALLARQRPVDPEAYEAYLRGMALGRKWGRSDFENARKFLELAIEKDPRFAPAYAELALAYSHAGIVYFKGPEILPQARDAVMKALELDETLAEAQMALGLFRYVFEWDWSGADEAFQRALELNPKSAIAHNEYGQYLAYMGRFEEAVAECRQALYLSPLDLGMNQNLGWVLHHARRFDEAIVQFQKTLELLEEFPDPIKEHQIHKQLGWDYRHKGMFDEAAAEIDAVDEIRRREGWEGDPCREDRAKIYIELGRRDEVEDMIDELLSNPNVVPWTAAMLGDKDLAFRRLEEMYEEHNTHMLFLKMAVELESLRSDPRYDDLMRRMNFPE
jgi:TolB-like protein/Tfp pilus assembly protein PilF